MYSPRTKKISICIYTPGGPADAQKTAPLHPGGQLEVDPDIGAVVVGLDTQINYYKIQYAQLCLNTLPSCLFLATNQDAVTHLTDAQEWAGSGAIVGAIRGCTGRDPVVVGKPSSLLLDYIARTLGVDKGRMCMVGDRLDTDVLFGQRSGLRTVLTLSGVTRECILLSDANTILPDHYVNSIADFFAD
ncbi:hypothetical protein EON64_03305 [archaeon]|nr:MAG: hypothetical protein EON64_03305 [archaeon]